MNNLALNIKNISKSFGTKTILDQLSLSVPKGSVFGLLGKNGAGKTTLIKCALGLMKPQSGEITVLSDNPWIFREATKEKLGYVPQTERLYPWLTVRQLIHYTASFYSHWNEDLVNGLITDWELNPEDRVGLLSEGQAQKLSIILALGHEPELLVFDEPVASLDPAARRQFLKTILQIVSDKKVTVFFSTHITSDLERVADRVAVLKNGKIDFCGELDDLKDAVKRLRIPKIDQLPDRMTINGLIYCEEEPDGLIIAVRDFREEMKRHIENTWNVTVEVEDLNLEEIFLELNR